MRSAGIWFVVAGALAIARAAIELADPVYWNPSSVLDYIAALLTTVAWATAGVAFVLWWRTTPIRRGAVFLLISGVGTAVSGVGNLLEDVLNLEVGELLFTLGGMTGAIAALVAAVLILTVRDPLRWSSLLLFTFVAGGVFPDDGGQIVTAVSLVALGVWLFLYRPRVAR